MARILVVDDESNIRMMVRMGLQAVGHQVETAADGEEAINKFNDGSGWDLVVLDQRMPGMDGLQVLHELHKRHPATRVIMITAFGTIDLAADALKAGATDFLRKPFTLEVLRDAVQSALENTARPKVDMPSREVESSYGALGLTSINGYKIISESDCAPEKTASPKYEGESESAEVRHEFMVRTPAGEVKACTVLLPQYFIELVKAHTDLDVIPEAENFWRWLCEESLANYLWQNADLPARGILQVEELTTGLRRWIDVVLTK